MKVKNKNIIKLIDYLYKNNCYFELYGAEDQNEEMVTLSIAIKEKLEAKGIVGIEVDIIQHYIYCALEIISSYDDVDKISAEYYLHYLLGLSRKKLTDKAYESLKSMLFAIYEKGASLFLTGDINRLSVRYLFLDYPDATLQAYLHFVDQEALFSKKVNLNKVIISPNFLIRLGLLLEFEFSRYRFIDYLNLSQEYTYESLNELYVEAQNLYENELKKYDEKEKSILNYMGRIEFCNTEFKRYFNMIKSNELDLNINADSYLDEILHMSTKVFELIEYKNSIINKGTDILGLLGVLELKRRQKVVPTMPIYNEYEENLSIYSSCILLEKGITLSGKTIYLRYAKKETSDFYQMIEVYDMIRKKMNGISLWFSGVSLCSFSWKMEEIYKKPL